MFRAALALAVALLVAGCGGGGSDEYAGLSRAGALQQTAQAVYSATSEPSDPLYGHRLRLLDLTRGRDLAGDRAWLGRYEDARTGDRLCVWVSGSLLGGSTNVRQCPQAPAPPPAPPPPPPAA